MSARKGAQSGRVGVAARGNSGAAPSTSGPAPPLPPRLQTRNAKGGVVFHEEEINDAFHLLNASGRDSFSREDLTDFLDKYFPGMLTVKEIRTLVGPNGMKVERLRKLLLDNDLPETFDPAQEAFKVFDPDGTGVMDMGVLKSILSKMPGVGDISQDDEAFLLQFMDANADGVVGLEDFAAIGNYADPTRGDQQVPQDVMNLAGAANVRDL